MPAGERNRGYALLMKANKPETVLYRAPTFSLLLVSHGGLVHALNTTVHPVQMAQFLVEEGACQPTKGWAQASGGQYFPSTPRGNLFAFESEDKFVLTCAQQQALIYQVRCACVCVCVCVCVRVCVCMHVVINSLEKSLMTIDADRISEAQLNRVKQLVIDKQLHN